MVPGLNPRDRVQELDTGERESEIYKMVEA